MWEVDLFNQVKGIFYEVLLAIEKDVWVWKPDEGDLFTVKSTYILLETLLGVAEARVCGSLWKSMVPSKLVAFSWKLLWDHIPTKRNLSIQSIIDLNASMNYVWCEGVD